MTWPIPVSPILPATCCMALGWQSHTFLFCKLCFPWNINFAFFFPADPFYIFSQEQESTLEELPVNYLWHHSTVLLQILPKFFFAMMPVRNKNKQPPPKKPQQISKQMTPTPQIKKILSSKQAPGYLQPIFFTLTSTTPCTFVPSVCLN